MLRVKRQGNELSINSIIAMALALIVLAIIAFLLIRSAGQANKGTDCIAQGGDCLSECNDKLPILSPYTCSGEKEKCCMNIGGLGQSDK